MKAIDLNGYKTSLSINNSNSFKTKIGGFLTILLSLLTLLSIIAFGRNLIYRTNPIVNISYNFIQTPILNKNIPFLFFNVMTSRAIEIPNLNRMIYYSLVMIDADGNRNGPKVIYTYLNLISCNETEHFQNNVHNITNYLLSTPSLYKCVNHSDPNLQDMEGSYGNSRSVSWAIYGEICKNTTANNNFCLPRETIEKELNSYRSQIGIFNYYIDSNDYENPLKPTFYSTVFRSSLYNSRQDIYFLSLVDYYSDNGFILDSNNKMEGIVVSRQLSETLYSSNPEFTLRLIITLDNLKVKYQRLYDKVQKLAADVGGIVKFLSLIIFFINSLYGKISVMRYLLKQMTPYNIQLSKDNIKTTNKNNYFKIEQNSIQLSKIENSKLNPTSNLNVIRLNEVRKIKELDTTYSIFDYVRFYIRCLQNKKTKILSNIEIYLKNTLSIEKLLVILREYEDIQKSTFVNKEEIKKKCYSDIVNN